MKFEITQAKLQDYYKQSRFKERKSFTIKDMIDQSEYNNIIEAVRVVSGYDAETKFFWTELGRKLGLHIKTCATIVQSFAIETRDNALLPKVENFLKLHEIIFFYQSRCQSKTLQEQKTMGCIQLTSFNKSCR